MFNLDGHYPFSLMPLPYEHKALAPILTEEILEYHHDKHLQTYVDNLNKAMESQKELQDKTLTDLLSHLDQLPSESQTAIKNNAGGVYNHQLYFMCLTDQKNSAPSKELAEAILPRLLEIKDVQNFGLVGNFNFTLNSATEFPSVLVETLFISNLWDEEQLIDPAFQKLMMKKTVQGLKDYLNGF